MNRPERAAVGRAGYSVSLWGQWIFLCVGAFALLNPAIGQGVQPSQDELKALGGYSDKEVIAEPPGRDEKDVLESPLVDPVVDLPFQIRDATTTSRLMVDTQEVIEATTIVVPPGQRGIGVTDVVTYTLDRNLKLEAARQDPLIAATRIDVEKSIFDPNAFATFSVSKQNRPVAGFFGGGISSVTGNTEVTRVWNSYRGLGSAQADPGLGVTQKFTSGMEATLKVENNRSDTSVDFFQPFAQEYNTDISLDVVQPLLRGYGPCVNLANVRIAYNNRMISDEGLRQSVLNTIAASHTAYWELVFSRVTLAIAQQSLGLAADLLRENRIRYRYGDLVIVEVYEADAGVRAREQEVIQAQNSYDNSMDRIRQLVNAQDAVQDWQIPLVPTDPAIYHAVNIDEDASLELAYEKNPQIRQAQLAIDNAKEGKVIAYDAFRPRLDLFAGVSETGLGETNGESYDNLFSGDYTSWRVGVNYSVPLKRRRERANIQAAKYEMEQAQVLYNDVRQGVLYNHREAVRTIKSLARQVTASESRVVAEGNRLEKQKISYEQGVTTSHDLLEVQEDYAQAQVQKIRAVVDYYLALIELERIRGTLLDTLGFEIVPMVRAN
ncbi:MAG: TolC family protein [Candidatus Omnitrophica bacterium]|nr:TolC family protein [Candidatus Omnitrophota bacterium]MCA9434143.1 TolC family protein [Candidatus Omnitrophota bacterium]